MSRQRATAAGERRKVYRFRNSTFYWCGHLQDDFNRLLLRAMHPDRLTLGRWRCLAVLAEERELTLGELARQTVINKAALTHVIDQMERDLLVARRSDPLDRRVIKVKLTPAGRKLFERLLPKAQQVQQRALRGVCEQDHLLVMTVLQKMSANLAD